MDGEAPRWLWRAALGLLAGVLLFAGVLLALALAGVSDPRPVGDPALDVAPGAAGRVFVPEASASRFATTSHTFTPPGTLELTARLAGGPPDAACGLWWGASPDAATLVAVTGSGYLAVLAVEGGEMLPVADWRRFPHIRPAGEANRLRADIADGQVTVLINDEVAAAFEVETVGAAGERPQQVGFYVETFEMGGAEVAFERLQVWEAARP